MQNAKCKIQNADNLFPIPTTWNLTFKEVNTRRTKNPPRSLLSVNEQADYCSATQ